MVPVIPAKPWHVPMLIPRHMAVFSTNQLIQAIKRYFSHLHRGAWTRTVNYLLCSKQIRERKTMTTGVLLCYQNILGWVQGSSRLWLLWNPHLNPQSMMSPKQQYKISISAAVPGQRSGSLEHPYPLPASVLIWKYTATHKLPTPLCEGVNWSSNPSKQFTISSLSCLSYTSMHCTYQHTMSSAAASFGVGYHGNTRDHYIHGNYTPILLWYKPVACSNSFHINDRALQSTRYP